MSVQLTLQNVVNQLNNPETGGKFLTNLLKRIQDTTPFPSDETAAQVDQWQATFLAAFRKADNSENEEDDDL